MDLPQEALDIITNIRSLPADEARTLMNTYKSGDDPYKMYYIQECRMRISQLEVGEVRTYNR